MKDPELNIVAERITFPTLDCQPDDIFHVVFERNLELVKEYGKYGLIGTAVATNVVTQCE